MEKINQCDIMFLCNAKQMKACKYYQRGFNIKQCMYFEEMQCINDIARLEALRNETETIENYMAEF